MKTKSTAIFYAILAAVLYAINVPLSKLLLNHAQPTMMASFLYLGAGLGLFFYSLIEKVTGNQAKRDPLTKKELPYAIAIVILDIISTVIMLDENKKQMENSICFIYRVINRILHRSKQLLLPFPS